MDIQMDIGFLFSKNNDYIRSMNLQILPDSRRWETPCLTALMTFFCNFRIMDMMRKKHEIDVDNFIKYNILFLFLHRPVLAHLT